MASQDTLIVWRILNQSQASNIPKAPKTTKDKGVGTEKQQNWGDERTPLFSLHRLFGALGIVCLLFLSNDDASGPAGVQSAVPVGLESVSVWFVWCSLMLERPEKNKHADDFSRGIYGLSIFVKHFFIIFPHFS